MKMVALIPARGGSKRIPRKNIKLLAGKPLIAYTIEAAKASGVFHRIVVSSDDHEILKVASDMGVRANLRPKELAADDSPDIDWVKLELSENSTWDAFAILRPTSPFRTAETIRRAFKQFNEYVLCDKKAKRSLRAVEVARQHPGKMWRLVAPGNWDRLAYTPFLAPALEDDSGYTEYIQNVPWHSCPTQVLPTYYVQNASLEMADSRLPLEDGVISSNYPCPFFTEGHEGFDINTPEDWEQAERIAASLYETPIASL